MDGVAGRGQPRAETVFGYLVSLPLVVRNHVSQAEIIPFARRINASCRTTVAWAMAYYLSP